MPEADYAPPQRLFLEDGECRVRFFSELDGDVIDYDFTTFAVARPLQEACARAFDAHVGPGGQINGTGGANNAFRQLNAFVKLLIKDERPASAPADLAPRHLTECLLSKGDAPTAGMMLGLLRALLVHVEGLTPQFAAKCSEWGAGPSGEDHFAGQLQR